MNTFILLSATTNNILTYVIGVALIALGIVLIYRHYRSKEGKEELKRFLSEIEKAVRDNIIGIIANIDFKDFVINAENVQQAEINFINELYRDIFNIVQRELDDIYTDQPLYKIMRNNLTMESISEFSSAILDYQPIHEMISKKIVDSVNTSEGEKLEEEYTKLAEAVEENDEYIKGETVEEVPLEKSVPNLVDEIIPPSEDGGDYDDGEVVEEYTETEENILTGQTEG